MVNSYLNTEIRAFSGHCEVSFRALVCRDGGLCTLPRYLYIYRQSMRTVDIMYMYITVRCIVLNNNWLYNFFEILMLRGANIHTQKTSSSGLLHVCSECIMNLSSFFCLHLIIQGYCTFFVVGKWFWCLARLYLTRLNSHKEEII